MSAPEGRVYGKAALEAIKAWKGEFAEEIMPPRLQTNPAYCYGPDGRISTRPKAIRNTRERLEMGCTPWAEVMEGVTGIGPGERETVMAWGFEESCSCGARPVVEYGKGLTERPLCAECAGREE